LEWSLAVIDICEHKPLLPISDTVAIAAEYGFDHPAQKASSSPIHNYSVLTTDFLVTVSSNGNEVQVARTVVYAGELEKPS
jgi:hypothetical protein